MALLYIDGFEGYGSMSDLAMMGTTNTCRISQIGGYQTPNSTVYRTTQPTASNSRSLYFQASGGGWAYTNYSIVARTELIMGMGIRFNGGGNYNQGMIAIGGPAPRSNSTGICITANVTAGTMAAYTNSGGGPGILLGTLANTYSSNLWYFMEIRIKLGTTTGELQIKIDGSDVLNLTGINTATGSLANYTGISIYAGGSSVYPSFYLDDLYICDTTGSSNNTFLGPISVYSLMPTSNGSTNQMTPIGAPSNWESVDEINPDTTTYVETSTTGNKDYYNFEDLPAGVSTVHGVLVKARSSTADNGGRKVKLNIKNGVSVIASTLRNLSLGSWFDDYFLSETAPDGSAWTKALVDSTEGGVEAAE